MQKLSWDWDFKENILLLETLWSQTNLKKLNNKCFIIYNGLYLKVNVQVIDLAIIK